MPNGKPAGVRCVQLDEQDRCKLFGEPTRPAVCRDFRPAADVCGNSRDEAMALITEWEQNT
jgi:hypothetical protein